jgi:hypothetical protein
VKKALQQATDAAKVARTSNIIQSLNNATQAVRSQRSRLRRAKDSLQRGGLRRMSKRWFPRRNLLPFYLKDPPGVKMDVHYGAVARLPVDTRRMLSTAWLPQRSRAAVPTEEGTVERAATLQPEPAHVDALLRSVQVQPVLKACGSVTLGKFRRLWLDHTKVAGSLDVGLQRANRFGLPGFSKRTGVAHLAALSVRQQIWGPVRGCADMRWELSPSEEAVGRYVPGPDLVSRLRCHLSSLRAQRLDSAYGLDFVAGVASVAVWFCPVRRQGMIELRA